MLPIQAIALVSVGAFTPGTPSTDAAQLTADAPFTATVAHVSTNAGARGSLFFMGVEFDGSITAPTDATDDTLGRELFTSHGTAPEARAGLTLGAFDAHEQLHFAYLITRGVRVAPTGSLFTTSGDLDPAHLTVVSTTVDGDTTTYRVGVEDIRVAAHSDWDYNDVVFDVALTTVPTPGSGALALAGLALVSRRRRA